MEQLIPVAVTAALGLAGWVINTLITKKIDALEQGRADDKKEYYNYVNGQRAAFEILLKEYVRRDMYEQAMVFHQKETDQKFNGLVESMNKQFENVEGKIDDIKDLINEKFNGKNKNGNM